MFIRKAAELMNNDFEAISPTAVVTSYPRSFTDIPLEKEIFAWLKQNLPTEVDLRKELAPEIEARYKLINKLLDESQIKQVLELAAGYSSRGMIYAHNNYNYVEMDLKSVIDNKKLIVKALKQETSNLNLIAGNALIATDFAKVQTYLKANEPVAIINEGLLRYLTFAEKAQVAMHIYNTLKQYGGIWITCDVTPKNFIAAQDKALPNFNNNLSNISYRNNLQDRFVDLDHVKTFFAELGFEIIKVEKFSVVKKELSSINDYQIVSSDILATLEEAIVAVLKIKTN